MPTKPCHVSTPSRSSELSIVRLTTALVVCAFLLMACAGQEDEAQIAENIAAIKEAVEEKDFYAIQTYLHNSFAANERLGIDEVKQLLRVHSLRHKNINVTIVDTTTTMHANFSDRADTVVSVILTGSSGLLPSDGSIRRVNLEWVKDADTWLIRKAAWRE